MALPRVQFKKLSVEENLDSLVYYAKPENSKNSPLDFYQFTLRLFPTLKGKLREQMSDEEVYMILDQEVRPVLEGLYHHSTEVEEYQNIWDPINDAIMEDLAFRLHIQWPEEEIICRVGLLPVCPRDILGKTFDLNYGSKNAKIIAIAIHELCHFLYFEKWKEVYPDYREEEFDHPHIAWYLSEAMIDPLINNEIFKKYTNEDLSAYSVFYQTLIDGKSVIDHLRSYVENESIEEAIRRGYELFQKNEVIIKK